ncbi:C6 transcription factor [Paramyrothecium foliicola]|nr:C6 transcription factor [Paramyrothecium foliicola]
MEPTPSPYQVGTTAQAGMPSAVAASEPRPDPEAGTGGGDPLLDFQFIGLSDQACKECRRRKARCNRALPTCDLCIRYRRHCLYEKHSRTPLTRKHLTEVEARLERAEVLVKHMRELVPAHLRTWERQTQNTTTVLPAATPFDFSNAPDSAPQTTVTEHQQLTEVSASQAVASSQAIHSKQMSSHNQRGPENDSQRMLEGPPMDDFEWSEMETSIYPNGCSPDAAVPGAEDESPISDGMASLSVNEREAGYLGVASGAALLRLLEPSSRRRTSSRSQQFAPPIYHMTQQPNPNRHVTEAMIDAYFRLYHVSYPIIHEPTFRAQYSEVIPRPNGPCWTVLAYVVAAIGVWTSSTTSTENLDMALFAQARSLLSFNFLEVGNITLVQALTLASNYQQKRDKPNSGYNYLGLAVRMAMGLGLHKEFQGWNISPLTMEIRRRVWWSLCVFDVGATVTFSRPDVWPYKGVEVSFPLNVNDKDLTAASQAYPLESSQITPYTAVSTQARFHIATHEIYDRVISKPFPSASELFRLEGSLIESWQAEVPSCFSETAKVPPRYALSQAVMSWRLRNLRIIMYRPFVIRRALRRKADHEESNSKAYERCLADAKSTITMIATFWDQHEHNRLAAWYGLYFLFQAALIPCICLRNDPSAPAASDWRTQITTTLHAIAAMSRANASSARCHQIISDLCGRYINTSQTEPLVEHTNLQTEQVAAGPTVDAAELESWIAQGPVGESPQTQINNVFSMMWPNVPPLEAADVVMGDDAGWMEFLRAGSHENWSAPNT